MPQIPIYERKVSIQAQPGLSLDANAVARQQAGPLQQFAAGLDDAADRMFRKDDEDAQIDAAKRWSGFQLQWLNEFETRKQNAEPGAPGFVDAFRKDYDSALNEFKGTFKTNLKAQQFVEQNSASFTTSLGHSVATFAGQAEVAKRKTDFQETTDNYAKMVRSDPRRVDQAIAELDNTLRNAGIPPVQQEALRKWYRAEIGQHAMLARVESNPWQAVKDLKAGTFDHLVTADAKDKLIRSGIAEQRHREAEGRRVQNEAWQTNYAQARINARDGLLTREDIDASVKAKLLPPAARDDLYALVDRSMLAGQQRALLIESVQNSLATGAPLDPKNKDYKKAADLTFDTMWPNVSQMLASPETRALGIQAVTDFAGKTTILPERVESQIRADLRSQDPARIAAAAELTDRIASVNPRLLDGFDKKDIDLAVVANQNIRAGVDQKRAVDLAQTKVNAADDPEIERRKAWVASDAGKDAIAKRVDADLSDLSRNIFGRVLNWNFNATDVPDGLKAEYQRLAEQNYLRTGDAEAARTLAKQDILKVWGRTEIGGDRWMKYAPENFYKVGADDDGGWIKKQLIREVKERHAFDEKTFNADKQIRLAVTPEGARAKDANGNPAPFYVVQTIDGGVLKELRDAKTGALVYWRPDWKSSDEYKAQVEKAKTRSEELKKEGDDAVLRAQQRRQDNLSRDPVTGLPKGVKKKGLGDVMQELQPPPSLSLNPRGIDGLE